MLIFICESAQTRFKAECQKGLFHKYIILSYSLFGGYCWILLHGEGVPCMITAVVVVRTAQWWNINAHVIFSSLSG